METTGSSAALPAGVTQRRLVLAVTPVAAVVVAMLGCIGSCVGYPCVPTGLRYGVWTDTCPVTDLRLDVDVSAAGVLRGQPGGTLSLTPRARWLDGDDRRASEVTAVLRRGYAWDVELRDATGAVVPGLELGRARRWEGVTTDLQLPDVPDGDYTLAVTVDAGFESSTVEVPLPVYAPAIVHLMTDRPLYKPGQDVLLRSVTLRRTDLQPLPLRPGRWRIVDPNGVEMLVEKDAGSTWGVADGSFPLDTSATIGRWTAQWVTGDASDTVTFDVRPFRLPRFVVDAAPARSWYRIGDTVVVEGRALYTSGAPVANAPVEVTLAADRSSGRWELPLAWEEVHTARTGPDGRYSVVYGEVPPDLTDQTDLLGFVTVTDATGEAAHGQTKVVVSHQSLALSAMTELGGGLVGGFNNRAYLRVASPDGKPLANAQITVRRPYDPTDPGKAAVTDEDGVASLQIDPGPPVTVVEPAPPVRIRPMKAAPPQLMQVIDVALGAPVTDLDAARALDDVRPAVERCAPLAIGDGRVDVGIQISAAGAVRKVSAGPDALEACVGRAMATLRLPVGTERTWRIGWMVPDPQLPSLSWTTAEAHGADARVGPALFQATRDARAACLAPGQGVSGAPVLVAHWAIDEGSRAIAVAVEERPGHGLSPAAIGCLRQSLSGLTLDEPATAAAMGAATGTLSVPTPPGYAAPQPTTRTAYELAVTAASGTEVLGDGKIVIDVGAVPPLRLRAEPSLALPGDKLTVEMIRGPGFYGDLPRELDLMDGTRRLATGPVSDKGAEITIPTDAAGFLYVAWGGARTIVFVHPKDPLTVEVSTDHEAYRPGDTASLTVRTASGARPVAAAVGLVGVDAALAQLAPLVGPDDFGRVTVRATSATPAFGAFDARALALGQIRGENAAKAAVLAISDLPMEPGGDAPAMGAGSARADTADKLTRNFYRALDRATERLRTWEKDAPATELLQPTAMVALWDGALADLRATGEPAVDGYGRELTLEVLPPQLLALTDPRTLVSDAARLPEDFVGWTQYVEQEVLR